MVELRRIVRFCVNPPAGGGPGETPADYERAANGFGGVPAMRGLGRYYELEALCSGVPDPRTGYLINIKEIDRAVRSAAVPLIEQACHERPESEPTDLIAELFVACAGALDVPLVSLRWRLTPTYSVEVQADGPSRVVMRQRFDLAAAHRLHVPAMTEAENRAVFGRCNNPSGHGHNYRIEPAVAFVPSRTGTPFTVADLERLTVSAVVDPFDHTHLNKDTAPFAEDGGLNPSVENIARVFFERLDAALRAERHDVVLVSMTVWETDRTSCTYHGGGSTPPVTNPPTHQRVP